MLPGPTGQAADRALAELRSAIAAAPEDRAPRRAFARALREAARWPALVEALREELSAACRAPADRREVLLEIAEISQGPLRQDAAALAALRQALELDGGDLEVLDRVAALHEGAKQWYELSQVLSRRVQYVADPAERVSLYV